jgi:hypothetical protein
MDTKDWEGMKLASAAADAQLNYYRNKMLNWNESDPFKVQVGGNHYARFAIQPMEYIEKNNLPFADGSVVKYITRWRFKHETIDGRLEDLRKAKHFIDMLIALEERKSDDQK